MKCECDHIQENANKYTIRNCPCIFLNSNNIYVCDDLNNKELVNCKDITDCVMKQIVELCKEEWDLRPDMNIDDNFPKEILQLLEIEEVDE